MVLSAMVITHPGKKSDGPNGISSQDFTDTPQSENAQNNRNAGDRIREG